MGNGPVCLSCSQSRDPDKCDTISICEKGELCHIEERRNFGFTFYTSGCLSEHLCRHFLSPTDIFGRRAIHHQKRTVTCAGCCHDNLCNNKCQLNNASTTTNTTPYTTTTPQHYSTTHVYTSQTTAAVTSPRISTSHMGTEFVLMFTKCYDGATLLQLIITSNMVATVEVYSPYPGINRTVVITNGVVHVILPSAIDHITSRITPRGIFVKSDVPITVVGVSRQSCCAALSFYAIPLQMLGQSYIVLTRDGHRDECFGIVTVENNTNIVITDNLLSRAIIFGQNTSFVLNSVQSYYYSGSAKDITMTKIMSNKPIAVFSGNEKYRAGDGDEDTTSYSIPPTDKWGYEFIVPLTIENYIMLKIISSNANNTINITGNNCSKTLQLAEVFEVELVSGAYSISASSSILVSLITKYLNYTINPIMTIVPAISQYSNDYVVAIPSFYHVSNTNHFVSIMIKSVYASGLTVNGNNPSTLKQATVQLRSESYTCLMIQLTEAIAYKIRHPKADITFGAIVFGYSNHEAIAYPAGLRLK